MEALAQAQPNIALVKYWGKRDAALNLPESGSLSITLDSLRTRTHVRFDAVLRRDEMSLDGAPHAPAPQRVSTCLDLLRRRAGVSLHARVDSENDFPTSAGLASSSSGFAALVVAAAAALGLALEPRELSLIARRGSGSAARSIFGGFVEMAAGVRDDGEDACAAPLLRAADWPLAVVIAITSRLPKATGSSAGMELTRATSPFYPAWLAATTADLAEARDAVARRDFAVLAAVSERNCLRMHAAMLASRPPLLYMNGATVECVHRIRALRDEEGLGTFFTVDAGPQVKAVCLPSDAPRVAAELRTVPGALAVLVGGLGEGAHTLAAHAPAASEVR
jgi:diphosphomevalonate decarboxylase